MQATELTVMLAAIGGFALQELINIRKGIKGNPNSPSKFKLGYYFTRWSNWLNIVINAIGSSVLFLGRHEVGAFATALPFVSGLGDTTPVLVGGAIGFAGPWVVRKGTQLLEKDTAKPDGE